MKLKKHQEISLKVPEFEVDNPLSPHLDEITHFIISFK